MSVITEDARPAIPAPRIATESLRAVLLWLMGFGGAFVFIEPSPYEVIALLAMFLFGITGLAMRPALVPLLLLLGLLNIGYATAVVQVSDQPKLVTWVLVSAFLAGTAVFYAAVASENPQARVKWLFRGYKAAGLLAATIGIAAYFRLFGSFSDTFLLYDRARGTFNDPNVLGAFLVLPALLAFQQVLAGRFAAVIGNGLMLLVLLLGILLTFSRAAWGQVAMCCVLLMVMTYIASTSRSERIRIVLIAMVGMLAVAALVMVLLSHGDIAEQFKERAALEQSYDVGHYGRFGRYILGAEVALEHPLGLGPLQFSRLFVEDPHNTFLNAFMSGGWLAGIAYLTLCAVTVIRGLRFVFAATPWGPAYRAVYAAYLGVVVESAIVDIDHWRHYFLILGVLWGLMAASRAYLAANATRGAIVGTDTGRG